MFNQTQVDLTDAEELLRNAELRNELEPYMDEAVTSVNIQHFSLRDENEFLASMLAWETAPILPIYQWFHPELKLPRPESLPDEQLHNLLYEVIGQLYQRDIVLDFTDHLTDRELYSMIVRDILPAREKMLEHRCGCIHFNCSITEADPSVWLTYYATDDERFAWEDSSHGCLPPKRLPTFHRDLPQNPI